MICTPKVRQTFGVHIKSFCRMFWRKGMGSELQCNFSSEKLSIGKDCRSAVDQKDCRSSVSRKDPTGSRR